MGYVDGGGLGIRPVRGLRLGVAGGRGALPSSTGFETGGSKLGGYVEASDPALGAPRWHALAGAIRLDDADITRRQFVMLRGDARLGARVQTFEYAEIDVNPGWKRVLGESHVELTSWSIGTQIVAHRQVDFTATLDSRRDLLLPEQRETPPEQRLLQTTRGVSGAVHVQPWRWASLRLGGDFRKRTDGTRTTRAVDASFYGNPPSLPALSGGIHANIYDASPGRGQLYDLSLAYRATPWLDVRAAGGTQHADFSTATPSSTDTFWIRGGAGIQAPHGLWLEASGEWRDATRSREWYLEAGERF
jgi:hypothetical protein